MSIRLTFLFAGLSVLAAVHIAALHFYLYWHYLWLDIPMHILGGICVALGFSVLPLFRVRLGGWSRTVYGYLGFVIVIGLLWELFEYQAGVSLAGESSFVLDTSLDMIFDVFGGYLGYLLVQRFDMLSRN
jgi:hypothetical protein